MIFIFKDDIITELVCRFEGMEDFFDFLIKNRNDAYFEDKEKFNVFCRRIIEELEKDMKF